MNINLELTIQYDSPNITGVPNIVVRNAIAAALLLGSFAGCRASKIRDRLVPTVSVVPSTTYNCCAAVVPDVCIDLKLAPGNKIIEPDGNIISASCVPK